jgi:protein-tyrosine phosphatase
MSIFGKVFGSKSKIDLTMLGVDMHNHFLPGIDDGAKKIEESIEMLQKMEQLGYSKIVMTPHIYPGLYENNKEIISSAFAKVKQAQHLFPSLELDFAAEYFFDDGLFDKISNSELLCFYGNHVLFEFSFLNMPQRTDDLYFKLHAKNYQGILAHVERYPYFHGDFESMQEIRNRGILLQLNLLSLTGRYGPTVKKQAEQLIDRSLIDIVATDAHRIEHLVLLEQHLSSKYFQKLMKLPLLNFTWK